eukprot:767888-Hanusia_phi.AAC.4
MSARNAKQDEKESDLLYIKPKAARKSQVLSMTAGGWMALGASPDNEDERRGGAFAIRAGVVLMTFQEFLASLKARKTQSCAD